jgi:hypothetical protein
MIRDTYSRYYVAPAANACAVTPRKAVFFVGLCETINFEISLELHVLSSLNKRSGFGMISICMRGPERLNNSLSVVERCSVIKILWLKNQRLFRRALKTNWLDSLKQLKLF